MVSASLLYNSTIPGLHDLVHLRVIKSAAFIRFDPTADQIVDHAGEWAITLAVFAGFFIIPKLAFLLIHYLAQCCVCCGCCGSNKPDRRPQTPSVMRSCRRFWAVLFALIAIGGAAFALIPDDLHGEHSKIQQIFTNVHGYEKEVRAVTTDQFGIALKQAEMSVTDIRRTKPEPTGEAKKALDNVATIVQVALRDQEQVLRAIPDFSDYDDLDRYEDDPRKWTFAGLGGLILLLSLGLLTGASSGCCPSNKGCRGCCSSIVSTLVFVIWLALGVMFGLLVGMADVCVQPKDIALHSISRWAPAEQLPTFKLMLHCPANSTTTMQDHIGNAQRSMNLLEKEFDKLIAWADPYPEQKRQVSVLIEEAGRAETSLIKLYPLVGCAPLNQLYQSLETRLCGPLYSQVALTLLGLGVACVALLLSLFCIPIRRKNVAEADETGEYIPLDHDFKLLPPEKEVKHGGGYSSLPAGSGPSSAYYATNDPINAQGYHYLSPPPSYGQVQNEYYPQISPGPVGVQYFNPVSGQFETRSTTPRNPFGY